MEQKITTPAVKGLLISLVMIIFGIIVYFAGQIENQGLSSLQYVILFGGIIWSCITYAKQMNGNVTFGNVFGHGFKTTAAIAAIMAVYTFISVKFLFPDIVDKSIEAARKNMQEQNLSDSQMQTALDITRKFFLPFAIGGLLLFFAIAGCIASLIGAAVAKKNPQSQNPFEKQ